MNLSIFLNLTLFEKIVLIIAIVLITLYVSFVILVVIERNKFSTRLKRKIDCLTILAIEERRLILQIDNIFKKEGFVFDEKYKSYFSSILKLSMSKAGGKSIHTTLQLLSNYRKQITKILNGPELENVIPAVEIRRDFEDIDNEKRKQIATYNSDIDAYNYWINVAPTKWIFFLVRIKNKSRL